MKYWRGYLVAALAAAGIWGLRAFAQSHSVLVDMVYPYVSRMIQTFLANWSGGVSFCVWQVLLMLLIALALGSIVLMIVFKWNPIQWLGWVLACAGLIGLVNTGVYGLNAYAGDLTQDIRLQNVEYKYTLSELEAAAVFYRDKANQLADQVSRNDSAELAFPGFSELAVQAAEGFRVLTYERFYSVFAGSTVPVKELTNGYFSSKGITGVTVALTGESAVNSQIPTVCLPYAMCHEMAHRMSIAIDRDADFAAFMACDANTAVEFQYSAYFMAFRHCYEAMKSLGQTELSNYEAGIGSNLRHDLDSYDRYFGNNLDLDSEVCDLLVIWHIEKYVLPLHQEEEKTFDPKDEDAVDLSGIVNAKPKE
ncbi:MAG: DUF3810 family protein [Oscillospiraceae bacterium]|nr:DUF3810 family protein [Oscillospiraceae bacterium]